MPATEGKAARPDAAERKAGKPDLERLAGFVGSTVTIYTTSGGESGVGITGVLESVGPCVVKLINCKGPDPCCALGSACTGGRISGGFVNGDMACGCIGGKRGFYNGCGCFYNCGCRGYGDGLSAVGSVTVIPVDRIAAYVHNTV